MCRVKWTLNLAVNTRAASVETNKLSSVLARLHNDGERGDSRRRMRNKI